MRMVLAAFLLPALCAGGLARAGVPLRHVTRSAYTLTVDIRGKGMIALSDRRHLACNAAKSRCTRTFSLAATHGLTTLTATPASGWSFAGWANACTATEITCVPRGSGAMTVGARFVPLQGVSPTAPAPAPTTTTTTAPHPPPKPPTTTTSSPPPAPALGQAVPLGAPNYNSSAGVGGGPRQWYVRVDAATMSTSSNGAGAPLKAGEIFVAVSYSISYVDAAPDYAGDAPPPQSEWKVIYSWLSAEHAHAVSSAVAACSPHRAAGMAGFVPSIGRPTASRQWVSGTAYFPVPTACASDYTWFGVPLP
jgi:Divergent InlB B-repeat domain